MDWWYCSMFNEIKNGAAEITWQMNLLLALKKNVEITYLFCIYKAGKMYASLCIPKPHSVTFSQSLQVSLLFAFCMKPGEGSGSCCFCPTTHPVVNTLSHLGTARCRGEAMDCSPSYWDNRELCHFANIFVKL